MLSRVARAWDGRRTLAAIGAGIVVAIAVTGCGLGTSASSASGDATTPGAAQTATQAGGPPATVPDPCTLLGATDVSALGAMQGLTGQPAKPQGYEKACSWSAGSANDVVTLQIGRAYPPSANDLPKWQQDYLDLQQGEPVTGVGDGAKVDLGTPSHIVVAARYYVFWLEAYNGDASVGTLLQDAAKHVLAALPS